MLKSNILFIGVIFSIILVVSISPSYAEYTSPRKQIELGVLPEDVICRDGKVLVIRDNGKVACVHDSTANKKSWNIIKTEFLLLSETVISQSIAPITEEPILEQSEIIDLIISSDKEFVDDGREIKRSMLQRAPAPDFWYDKIISSEIKGFDVTESDPRLSSVRIILDTTLHEKYSINKGVGFYLEDWMPTYIPDGQKLLYADTYYSTYEISEKEYEVYYANYQFVPSTFVLHQNVTNYDLDVSKGFTIHIEHDTLPFDEVEDIIEKRNEILESQSGNYGGYRDMTRDGKMVAAYEGGNDLNHYQSLIGYNYDENTSVSVHSYYHTLDELIPIFNSIMK